MMDIVFRLKPHITENIHLAQSTATSRASDGKATRQVSIAVQIRVAGKSGLVPDYFHVITGVFNPGNLKSVLI